MMNMTKYRDLQKNQQQQQKKKKNAKREKQVDKKLDY